MAEASVDYLCGECGDLFQNPAHLQAFFPVTGLPQSVDWRRNLEDLKLQGTRGCCFCSLLVRWFKLPLSFWADLPVRSPGDVIFITTVDGRGHFCTIYLETVEGVEYDTKVDWLSLDLLTDAGMELTAGSPFSDLADSCKMIRQHHISKGASQTWRLILSETLLRPNNG